MFDPFLSIFHFPNMSQLFIGFLDGSLQEEKTKLTYVDRSNQSGLKIADHAYTFYVFSSPHLTSDYGSFNLKQMKNCVFYRDDMIKLQ